jgi:RNA polymerase sigma factor (sigma-70 family)
MSVIRLVLVDDQDLVRTSLKTFLSTQPDMVVAAEADNGADAIRLVQEHQPDLVLMDITMPKVDGHLIAHQICQLCTTCRVLILTIHTDRDYFLKMLAAGASGYLTKQAAADELLDAIHTIANGGVYLQPEMLTWLLQDYQQLVSQAKAQTIQTEDNHTAQRHLEALSAREKQVLKLVTQSLTNTEIGKLLAISPKTVARHRERIMNKLDFHSTTELVKFAIRTGLVTLH